MRIVKELPRLVGNDMVQTMRLTDVIERLSDFDGNDTIYALTPWVEDSPAIVASEPELGGLPFEAKEAGMTYFLEIAIASDFLEDWTASLKKAPNLSDMCVRLIEYALNDA